MEAAVDIEQELSVFGPRLRELRRRRQWTLDELSERSGLSKTFLSRLEAGGRQPSIAAVITLAKVFRVSVAALLEPIAAPEAACVVVRKGEAKRQSGDGLSYVPLSSPGRFANLQPIQLTISHRRAGDERFHHDGEEWLYVLGGRLQVQVGDATYALESGDAAHFDSRQPHRLTALGGKDAEVILVACPLAEDEPNQPRPRDSSRRQRRAIQQARHRA